MKAKSSLRIKLKLSTRDQTYTLLAQLIDKLIRKGEANTNMNFFRMTFVDLLEQALVP